MKRNTILLLIILSLFVSCTTVEKSGRTMNVLVPETTYKGLEVIDESEYAKQMDTIVVPYLESKRHYNVIYSKEDNHRIYYEYFDNENEKGTIVILHGFSEFVNKYNEVAYYFLKQNYDVYLIEHFGHGFSERNIEEDLSKVDVEDFSVYTTDLNQLMEEVVIPLQGKDNLFMFAHSMGGGIGTRYLELYPEVFKAAILSSPMNEINLGWPPEWLAKFISGSAIIFNSGTNYAMGQSSFNSEEEFTPYAASSSQARYSYYFNKRVENEYYQTYGATYNWINSAIKATRDMVRDAEKIQIPVLLFQAENDYLVKANGQLEIASLAKDVNVVFVPGSNHEIFNSSNDIVKPYFATIFAFLDKVD